MTQTYANVIQETEAMAKDKDAQALARNHRLQILNVTWEDTGRFKGSAVGPNISDMTIQVQRPIPGKSAFSLTCMPVIRYPNFSDLSGDISPDLFFLLVGNERGQNLKKIALRELLGNLRNHLHEPKSWNGERQSLLADRDSHVLVSAQACFLPIPSKGIAEFNPVLFNYQSREGDPAVLTILATREGTSITVIDNKRDAFKEGRTWGQRLFFNQNGKRCSLTGQRQSDFIAANDHQSPQENHSKDGLNMVLLVQVPLKQKKRPEPRGFAIGGSGVLRCRKSRACSDVEAAVIGHGKVEGPFTEIDNLEIERDDRFPIRVTVQFYKATSNGVVSEEDMADIAAQINRVYKEADYVGSLVVQGETGRPTEHSGEKFEPPDWWDVFWDRHFENTGQTREQAIGMLTILLGGTWNERPLEVVEKAMREARGK